MNARALAISILARVEATDAYLNVVLDSQLSEAVLDDPRDSGWVTEICYGTTRRRMTLDALLQTISERKLPQLEDKVLAALRMGTYQIFFTRTPRHAAVGETVEALKALGMGRAAGFTNAVLRKAAGIAELPLPPKTDLAEFLSVSESHPKSLVERWIRQFGLEKTESILAANNQAASVVLRVNRAKISRDDLLAQFKEAGVNAEPTTLSSEGLRLPSVGRVEDVFGFSEGLWQVQDEAAQLVSIYGDIPKNARVLDTCAAPGGKSCHLAQEREVVSCDLHVHKLRKIEAEAKRLGLSSRLTARAHDATEPFPEALGEFHAVVVDAPCSGSGTLRRHPELRYRRVDEDVLRLCTLQRKILESAQSMVQPGGLLVYAVCSLDFREGPDQMDMFLRSHPDFTLEPPNLPNLSLPLFQGALRTLPGPEGMDGFYAARLRRMY